MELELENKEEESFKAYSQILSEDIDTLTKEDEKELDLNNLDSFIVDRKPRIFTNDRPYSFTPENERADVYIKNYLMKFDMNKSLKVFEQEFFEKLSKGDINIDTIPNVPNIYIQSESFQEKIGNIQKELDDAKIYAEKANSLFLKLQSAKENEKIRHRRVQQEKQLLIKEIDNMKKVYEEDSQIYKDLKDRYETVTLQSVVRENELMRMKQKMENIVDQRDKMKKTLEESKKQAEKLLEQIDKKESKEERKGNKLIKWTPFPPSTKGFVGLANVQIASSRMNLFKSFAGHLASVTSIDFHPKKAIIGTASDDKTWKLWKFGTGELLMHGEGHKDWISCINFHPDGVLLATCGGDATIKLWNIIEEKCVYTIIDHAQPVWKNKFHWTGSFLLTACMDHTVRLYDMNNFKARVSYRAHVDSVNSINFLYKSNLFISGSADKTVSLWDMRSSICAQTYYGHNNAVNCANANVTGDLIASCDSDGLVKIWDLRMVRELVNFDESKQSANTLTFDKSGGLLTVGYDDSNIRVINVKNARVDNVYKGHEDAVLDLLYDHNNVVLLSCGADKTFKLWQ